MVRRTDLRDVKPAPLDILESRGFETGGCLYSSLASGEGGRKKDLNIYCHSPRGFCGNSEVPRAVGSPEVQHRASLVQVHLQSPRGPWLISTWSLTKRHKGSAVEESCDISFIWSFVPFRLNSAGWDHIRLT